MAITFYQAILAFCLQDGPEALTQVSSVKIARWYNFEKLGQFPLHRPKESFRIVPTCVRLGQKRTSLESI